MNDIVAEFASSYYKDEFDKVVLKQYHVVAGSVFSDEYNETLDSAVIVLDHIKKEDRLFVEPYQYVHTFDINNKANFDRLYLVDSFSEQEKNIHKNFFSYTINLMSETKLLEKIQCPNLTITHRVKQGATERLTIFEHIKRYIELYSPVIKKGSVTIYPPYTTWGYERIIRLPTVGTTNYEKFYDKFNVPCADLAFGMPTLRQVLTTLMQQVGCIPTLHGGELGFLDLRADPKSFGPDFTADYSVSRIQRSLSSDSYANTLVNISSNVLDSNNKVISERLGFRDKSSVTLKQTENLYLETKFPIYEVEKFVMQAASQMTGLINRGAFHAEDSEESYGWIRIVGISTQDYDQGAETELDIDLEIGKIYNQTQDIVQLAITDLKEIDLLFYTYFYDNDLNVLIDGDTGVGQQLVPITIHSPGQSQALQYNVILTVPLPYASSTDHFAVGVKAVRVIKRNDEIIDLPTDKYPVGFWNNIAYFDDEDMNIYLTKDITPLIKEQSERSNLETNYQKMNEAQSIEQLSTYLYGTVGYSIGSNRISGFSSNYSQAYEKIFGPTTITYTYLENIWNFVFGKNKIELIDIVKDATGINFFWNNFTASNFKISPYNPQDVINFTSVTFDIEYKPLNSFNMAFSKKGKDIPFAIEQLDTNESGLTDFDRLALKEQETVDRIGNVVLSISQRAKDLEDIRGNATGKFSLTYFRDDTHRDGHLSEEKYIIFKRQIAVNDYYYDVSYTGMENAILKDYFTSIRTKYRAYEYVNYESSTLRKERDVIYVRLGLDYVYNGSDNIHFPWSDNAKNFIDGFTIYEHNKKEYDIETDTYWSNDVRYACEVGWGVYWTNRQQTNVHVVKNDISVITTNNHLIFSYENDDNAGSGIYIISPFYTDYEVTEDDYERIGGIPQSWQIWQISPQEKTSPEDNQYAIAYNEKHPVVFSGYLDIAREANETHVGFISSNGIETIVKRQATLPIVNFGPNNDGTGSAWAVTNAKTRRFVIGKETNDEDEPVYSRGSRYNRLFYKDYSERINHTVQFDYYTLNPENIAWTELFIENSSLVQKYQFAPNEHLRLIMDPNSNASLQNDEQWHLFPKNVDNRSDEVSWDDIILLTTENGVPCIRINWGNYYVITVAIYKYEYGENFVKDIISFKRPTAAIELTPLTRSHADHVEPDIPPSIVYESTTKFYLSFNDTKSEYVFDRSEDGVLYKKGKVKTNVNSRQYEDL